MLNNTCFCFYRITVMAIIARSIDKEREGHGCSLPSNLPGHNRPKATVGRRSIQRYGELIYYSLHFVCSYNFNAK